MTGSLSVLARYRDRELSLDELVKAAGRSLRRFGLRPGDGRVAEAVDVRGVRYYQTLGVIDRPLRYDGRHAVYGYRHLLQLLAAKKLQQEGHPLPLIQRALAGRSSDALERALATAAGGESPPGRSAADETPNGAAQAGRCRLVAEHVAPGVTITIDTSQVPDPETVIAVVRRALSDARRI